MTSVPDAVSPLSRTPVIAAGAVVLRDGGGGGGADQSAAEVLLVHRPRYDDWSLPKGKVQLGEHLTACAVREVGEETGAQVVLGAPLLPQQYPLADGRPKAAHYWVARLRGEDPGPRFAPNAEVDAIRWAGWGEALGTLTYGRDRETVREAREWSVPTSTIVVLRHAEAMERGEFRRTHAGVPDAERPLTPRGRSRARALAAILDSYAPDVLVSSPAVRCVGTLHPYLRPEARPEPGPNGRAGAATGDPSATHLAGIHPLAVHPGLSQEAATEESVAQVVGDLLARPGRALLCSHRPVLPWVFSALGVDPVPLGTGEMAVVHLRDGEVVATEHHAPA